MPRPLLLLDVDGVLNPFIEGSRDAPAGFEEYDAAGIRIRLCADHGDWLRQLASDYELVWATTWEGEANSMIGERLGLPVLPHIRFSPPAKWDEEWTRKLPDVQAYVDNRRAAWVDDRFGEPEITWAQRRTDEGIPTLLVQPDSRIGLTEAHVRVLRTFAGDSPATRTGGQ